MFDFVNYGAGQFELFLTVLVRASGLFLIAPIFSQKTIPKMAKVGVVLLLSLITMMTLDSATLPSSGSFIDFLGFLFKEFLVGALIGFVFALMILAAQGAGAMVGYQVGLAIANELDPVTQQRASIIGTFWTVMAILVFLSLNGHHMIIQAFHQSYEAIPPGQVFLDGDVGTMFIKPTGFVFVLGLKIAAPVMVTLFLVDVALGTLAKMMPTMNVFFVGFPVKVSAGIAIIALSLPIFTYMMRNTLSYLNTEMSRVILALSRA